ncbi:MAG: porin family protein [Bacteroidetes bacterium]|nr:porin family protein [Bacteroidota bacterium]
MKKISLFFVVVLCAIVCFSNSSNAQTINKLYTGLNLGISSFTSGGGDSPTDVHLGLESSYRLNYNYALVATAAATWDVNATFWEVTVNGRYYFQPESEYKFFGEAGLGAYTLKAEVFGIVLESKTYAGINLGGGVSKGFFSDKLIVNLKVKYHNPFTTGGVKANWVNTTIGLSVPL